MKLVGNSLALLLSIAAGFVAAKDPPKFVPGPASSYPAKQTVDKLTIAAIAYDTEEVAKTAFGKVNPNQYGILPILVVMDYTGDQALYLENMSVRYIAPDGSHIEATPASEVPFVIGPKRPNLGGPKSPIPLPRSGKKNPLNGWELQGRAFLAKMLPPHQSAHGFFYFNTAHFRASQLYITGIREAATGKELFYFEIPLTKTAP
jgi:hypothetical protein